MSKRLTKKEKVLNLLSKGKNVTWKTLRKRFDLNSPTAMIHTLRKEGHAIYRNMTPSGVAFRLGSPTKSMIAAGIVAVLGADQAYKS
jgi:hypothetical protein|tara:strand:+ start:285 stop:545 length:261 start_codon:yes stop_codon:yes gene_type:complete